MKTLVELGYRISVIHEDAGVHSPTTENLLIYPHLILPWVNSSQKENGGKVLVKKSKDKTKKNQLSFLSTPEENVWFR